MKKAIFLVIISLTLQGFSQVRSGVYKGTERVEFMWKNGEQDGDTYYSESSFLLHITNNGFRAYKKPLDTGNSWPIIYIGKDRDGYETYAVPFGDRLEWSPERDVAILFYDFDNETGWYQKSIEWHGLEYISNVPILEYED